MESETVSTKHRVLAVAFYLGFAPLLRTVTVRRFVPFVCYHHAHAAAAFGVLAVLLLIAPIMLAVDVYLLINHRGFHESGPASVLGGFCWILLGSAMLYAWGPGLLYAVRGAQRNVKGMVWLASRAKVLAVGRITGVALLLTTGFLAAMSFRAVSLSERDGTPGTVYMLYDDFGVVPRWVFCLGFYRMSVAATDRWGPGSVVVDELSLRSFGNALRRGKVVFVASHGTDGRIVISKAGLPPLDTLTGIVNSDLRLVYFAACDAGREAANWERVLAPARVITFDRLSAVVEHIWWLWTAGPREISSLR